MHKEAMLYETMEDKKVHCFLCRHHCKIVDSRFGFCNVRQNIDGRLYTHAYGEVVAAHVDPIEKKPLYHFLPGTFSFSIAAKGCNFRCGFCQNWQISQVSEENATNPMEHPFSPEDIVKTALKEDCRSISYTYTEPTIFFEYAYDTARLAAEAGLANVFVTNGYMSAEALETIHPFLNACNVDLKSFTDAFYKTNCRAHLEPVLETIRLIKKSGIWLEITTLLIPGQNDSDEEIRNIARFIAELDKDIPWHISRFHPDYRFTGAPTPMDTLKRALAIGESEGLSFIYIGNTPGEVTYTKCPNCKNKLIQRKGFQVIEQRLESGRCPDCGRPLPGVFGSSGNE